jgi:hypothetical protein
LSHQSLNVVARVVLTHANESSRADIRAIQRRFFWY